MTKKAIEVAARYRRKYWREVDLGMFENYHTSAFSYSTWPVITESEELQTFQWGLIPYWVKDSETAQKLRAMTINAKTETIFEKPSFKNAIIQRRCIIPSTGFFEWRHEGNKKIPYFIYLKNQEIFSMAGIYESWKNPQTGQDIHSYSILTTPANTLMEFIHNTKKRMPFILSLEEEEAWLTPNLKTTDIQAFFNPFDESQMDAYILNSDFLKKSPHDASILLRA